MTASDDLLRRLEGDEELAYLLYSHGDFAIGKRDPVEKLALANGLPLTPIAGDDSGGTYFLCGEQSDPERPVLYADSEGGAVLMAASLVDAVELIVHFPYWQELPFGFDPGEPRRPRGLRRSPRGTNFCTRPQPADTRRGAGTSAGRRRTV